MYFCVYKKLFSFFVLKKNAGRTVQIKARDFFVVVDNQSLYKTTTTQQRRKFFLYSFHYYCIVNFKLWMHINSRKRKKVYKKLV